MKHYSKFIKILFTIIFFLSGFLLVQADGSTELKEQINQIRETLESTANSLIKEDDRKEDVINEIRNEFNSLKDELSTTSSSTIKKELEENTRGQIVNIYANTQENKDMAENYREFYKEELNENISVDYSRELLEENMTTSNGDIVIFVDSNKSQTELEKKYTTLDSNLEVRNVVGNYYEIKIKKGNDSSVEKYFFDRFSEGEIPSEILGEEVVYPELVYIDSSTSGVLSGEKISQQRGIVKIGADQTLDFIKDNKKTDVVVAVIDSGVDYNNSDLKNVMWINKDEIAGNGIDDDNNGIIDDIYGADLSYGAPDEGDPMGGADHGTHCAGIVAADNNGSGVVGVNPYAQIMAVKIFPGKKITASTYNIVNGIMYAVDNGADVLSMSLGGEGTGVAYKYAIEYATNNGVIVVTSAGNNNSSASKYSPGNLTETINVAATDSNDKKASFSNFGPAVDIAAPGVGILSPIMGDKFGSFNGTSMAAPMVSGAISAYIQIYGKKSYSEFKQLLEDTGDDVALDISGKRLNVVNFLNANNYTPDPDDGDDTDPIDTDTGINVSTINWVTPSQIKLGYTNIVNCSITLDDNTINYCNKLDKDEYSVEIISGSDILQTISNSNYYLYKGIKTGTAELKLTIGGQEKTIEIKVYSISVDDEDDNEDDEDNDNSLDIKSIRYLSPSSIYVGKMNKINCIFLKNNNLGNYCTSLRKNLYDIEIIEGKQYAEFVSNSYYYIIKGLKQGKIQVKVTIGGKEETFSINIIDQNIKEETVIEEPEDIENPEDDEEDDTETPEVEIPEDDSELIKQINRLSLSSIDVGEMIRLNCTFLQENNVGKYCTSLDKNDYKMEIIEGKENAEFTSNNYYYVLKGLKQGNIEIKVTVGNKERSFTVKVIETNPSPESSEPEVDSNGIKQINRVSPTTIKPGYKYSIYCSYTLDDGTNKYCSSINTDEYNVEIIRGSSYVSLSNNDDNYYLTGIENGTARINITIGDTTFTKSITIYSDTSTNIRSSDTTTESTDSNDEGTERETNTEIRR